MTLVYRSVDGIIFDTEKECIKHENNLKAAKLIDHVHLWDEDKDVVEVTEDVFDSFDRVMFFRCDTEESYKVILDLLLDDGFGKGLITQGAHITWMWSEGEAKWQPINDEIEALQAKINELLALEER